MNNFLKSFLLLCSALGFALLAPLVADPQKIGSYDYADSKPRERLRPPLPAPPPKQLPDGMLAVPGVCGGILQNSPLQTLLSLDRDAYAAGDEFSFLLQVKALYPTRVPVRASLAEVEPSDPKQSYEWHSMGITLELSSPNHRPIWMGLLQLYGSKDVPGSDIELKAGEWIELRGKGKMEWTNPRRGSVRPEEEKWVLRYPLKHPQEFTAIALARRAEGHRFDAETGQEARVCYPAEQSSGVLVHLKITPNVTP